MFRPLILSAFVILAAAAHAQSSSSSHGSIDYSFGIDPGSLANAGDLTVADGGLLTYNLIVAVDPSPGADNSAYYAPYMNATGNGTAYAAVDPNTSFDSTNWMGYAAVASTASSSLVGTAAASVGIQESLILSNNGTEDITINVSATAHADGDASITGTASASNSADLDTYVGIYDYDFSTKTGANPLIHIHGPAGSVVTDYTPDWTALGGGDYVGGYSLTIAAGTQHALQFYTSARNVTAAVPEPASLAALGVGALGLLRRRRRA